MPAYVLVDIQITDPEVYEEYKRQTPPTVAAYGGKYLARGGQAELFHGNRIPERIVLLQFDSLEQARAWHDSPEYQALAAIRDRAAQVTMVAVEGVSRPVV